MVNVCSKTEFFLKFLAGVKWGYYWRVDGGG